MRGVNGDSTASNNPLETINAAASAIALAENRTTQATSQKRRWASRWSAYWCFGYQRHKKRIGHAVLVPETSAPGNDAPAENPPQASVNVLPFVAPPSSPVSFLPSEPPSAAQSPVGLSISANMYSPSGPSSIFAIGPYAHETQLVSPPVFSTFTTEPSTAPFTPLAESVHLTTPSSPEVPFAQLLDPSLQNGEAHRFPLCNYEFQSYQLYPGSPVGHLISPSSGISGSGTSSPFPDGEFTPDGPQFLEFRMGDPPKLFNLDKLSTRKWGSHQGSSILTPDPVRPAPFRIDPSHQFCDVASHPHSGNVNFNNQGIDCRASFKLNASNALRCMEEKPALSVKCMAESWENGATVEGENSSELGHSCGDCSGETSHNISGKAAIDEEELCKHQKHQSVTLGSIKEFNFDNGEGRDSRKLNIESDWWANGSVVEDNKGATKNWSFFPMIQSGVSSI